MKMVDVDELEKELNEMVRADNLYWLRNDAKFRAAKQNVSYEEFEKIVKTSHLRPLDKGDHLNVNKDKTTIWNVQSNPSKPRLCRPSTVSKKEDKSNPKNLSIIKPKSCKAKSSVISLQEVLDLIKELDENLTDEKSAQDALKKLAEITERPRFDLEWGFASKEEQTRGFELLNRIEKVLKHDDEKHILKLRSKFQNEWMNQ